MQDEGPGDWPADLAEAWAEDLLGPRAWAEHESCRGFAAEILTAFPSCIGLPPSALQQLGWTGKSGRTSVWGGSAGGEASAGAAAQGGGTELPRTSRYAARDARGRVHKTFMKCLAKFVNNVAARDNARLLLRVLAMACSIPAGRLVVARQLEGLLNSSAHSRAAQTVLELLVTHMGEGEGSGGEDDGDGADRADEAVVPVLLQLRLRPQHAGIIPTVAANLVRRHPRFTPLVVQLVSTQDIRDHTPHAMRCLSAVMEAAPGDWVAQSVAQTLQGLSTNSETKPHIRPFMRRLMKACSAAYRDWPDVWRHLMQPPEDAAGWSEPVREQWLLEVIQMVTFMQLLLIGDTPSTPLGKDGEGSPGGGGALETVAQFAAEAAEWCQAILCDLLPDISSSNLALAVRRLLFLEGRQAYFTSGEGVPEHESDAFNRLATGLPTSEDTLTRVVLMGLTDTPLSGEDALELAEALLRRSASAWAAQPQSRRAISRISNPQVLSALSRLAEYSPPAPPLAGIEPEEPLLPLARVTLYWKVLLVLVLVCALNFEDFGSVMLEEFPAVTALMEALATSRPCYPRAYESGPAEALEDPESKRAADDEEASLLLQKYLSQCGSLWAPPQEGLLRLNFSLVRAAPPEVLDQLMKIDVQYSLGKHIRSLSSPDILLNILEAMQQEEAWDWLVPILEHEPAASAKLPPEWSGTLLLELFDRLNTCEKAQRDPETTHTMINHSSKRLRDVLETADNWDSPVLMALTPIVDALLGESARQRDLAHSSLNAIFGEGLSESEAGSVAPVGDTSLRVRGHRLAWLRSLYSPGTPIVPGSSLVHEYTLMTVLPSLVSSMVYFESDPEDLEAYLNFLNENLDCLPGVESKGSFPLIVAVFLLCRPLTVDLLARERPATAAVVLTAVLQGLDHPVEPGGTLGAFEERPPPPVRKFNEAWPRGFKEISSVMSLYAEWFPDAPRPDIRAVLDTNGAQLECPHLALVAAVNAVKVVSQIMDGSLPEDVRNNYASLKCRVLGDFRGAKGLVATEPMVSVDGNAAVPLLAMDFFEQLACGSDRELCELALSKMQPSAVVGLLCANNNLSEVARGCLLEELDRFADESLIKQSVVQSGLLQTEVIAALVALRGSSNMEGSGGRAEGAIKRCMELDSSQRFLSYQGDDAMEVDGLGSSLGDDSSLAVSTSDLDGFIHSIFEPPCGTLSERSLSLELELQARAVTCRALSIGLNAHDAGISDPGFLPSLVSGLLCHARSRAEGSPAGSNLPAFCADPVRFAAVLQALVACESHLTPESKEKLEELCAFVEEKCIPVVGPSAAIAKTAAQVLKRTRPEYQRVPSSSGFSDIFIGLASAPGATAEKLEQSLVRADLESLRALGPYLRAAWCIPAGSDFPKAIVLDGLFLAAVNWEEFPDVIVFGCLSGPVMPHGARGDTPPRPTAGFDDGDERLTFSNLRMSTLFDCLAALDPGMEHCWELYAACLQKALPGCSTRASGPRQHSAFLWPNATPSLSLECAAKSLASPLRALLHEASWGQREAAVTKLVEKCSEVDLQLLIQGEGSDNEYDVEMRCAAAAATAVLDAVACYVQHPATWASWQESENHPRTSTRNQYFKIDASAASCLTKLILCEGLVSNLSYLRRFPILCSLFSEEDEVALAVFEALEVAAMCKEHAGAPRSARLRRLATSLKGKLHATLPARLGQLIRQRGGVHARADSLSVPEVDSLSSGVDAVFHRLVRKVCLSTGPDCVAAVESCSALGRILPLHFAKHLPAMAAFLKPLAEAVSAASNEDMTQICDMFSLIFDLLTSLGPGLWAAGSDSSQLCALNCMKVLDSLIAVILSAESAISKHLSPLCYRFLDYVQEQCLASEIFRAAAQDTIAPKIGHLQQAYPHIAALATLERSLESPQAPEDEDAIAAEKERVVATLCAFSSTVRPQAATSAHVREGVHDAFLCADALADIGRSSTECLECLTSLDRILSRDPSAIQSRKLQEALLRFTQSAEDDAWREASHRLITRFLSTNPETSGRNQPGALEAFCDLAVGNMLKSVEGAFGPSVRATALTFLPGMCRVSASRKPQLLALALRFCSEQSLGSLLAASQ